MKKVLACTVAVSLLFLGVPMPINAGVVAGVATEWTQILNHVQLVMNYIRMGVQLQIQMQQLSEQLKQGKGLPRQIFGSIQQDLGQLAQIVQGGKPWRIRWAIWMRSFAIRFLATVPALLGILTTTRNGRRPPSIPH